jgi:glycosyltransferase involved in cell wall biosynthesis
VVPNEFLQHELQGRHSIECRLIRNACEANRTQKRDIPWPYREGEVNIIYTGAIYHAHYDAFRNLTAAIQQLGRQDVRLHLYTAQQPADLERQNISGFVVYHPHLSSTQIMEVQQEADILFLPLAFDSPIPEVIKTSAPGKMSEYLSSGRPILVHAPPDTYLSWYFKQYECGLVVDRDDPVTLGSAIQQIIDDRALRERLCKNALLRAKTDFDIEVARSEFIKLFQNGKGK